MNYKACRISPCEPHKIIIHPNELKRKVYIETTSECNNNCRHCFNRSGDSSTRIPFPELVAMEELFTRSNNIIQVILSGGEFFTRPDYLEIVKLFSHKHDVQILTNGKILPKAMIDYLILHKNAELQITLAGDCSKIDALLRGECFEDTINNIKTLCSAECQDSFTVSTTLCKPNINRVKEIIELCISLGVKQLRFSFIYKMGRAIENWDDLFISTYEKILAVKLIKEFSAKYAAEIKILSSGMHQFGLMIGTNDRVYSCQELSEEISISPQLTTVFCPAYEMYCDCKDIEKPSYKAMFQAAYCIPNLKDSSCETCAVKGRCLVSCL